MTWLKAKWGWVVTGIMLVLTGVVVFISGQGISRSKIKAALALRKLQDATKQQLAAESNASALKKRSEALAEELLTEELSLASEKDKANALSPGAVVIDLQRRGLIKK